MQICIVRDRVESRNIKKEKLMFKYMKFLRQKISKKEIILRT